MGALRFALLGGIRAWRDDVELGLGSPQQQSVLALLLLAGNRPVATEEVAGMLWGDAIPVQASGTVRTYVYRLRQVLGTAAAPVISRSAGGYALAAGPGTVDADVLSGRLAVARSARARGDLALAAAELRAGLVLCSGVALAGGCGPALDRHRARLEQLKQQATEEHFAVEIERGNADAAVIGLPEAIAAQPLRERLRELLMHALYSTGRQADALAAYHDARRLLRSELGIEPGPGLQDMHQRILAADPLLVPAAGGPPAPRPLAVVPEQLPPDLPDFTGRDPELAFLAGVLSDPGPSPVAGLTGLGGAGKTALAVRAAQAARFRFPDGQIFVDLGGSGDHPADPRDVLGIFLRAAGSGGPLPDSLAERAALWQVIQAGRRLLLILDDARDEAQLRPLLPVTVGCAAIITCWQQLPDLPRARWTKISGLPPDNALQLIERVAGRDRVLQDPAACARIAAACSYYPLALRVAASRVQAKRRWPIARVEEQIYDELSRSALTDDGTMHEDCKRVTAPLEAAYGRLPPEAAAAFRLLSAQAAERITTRTAAAALGLGLLRTRGILEALVDAHVLECGAPDTYLFPSLIRAFARRKAELEEDSALVQRWYAESSKPGAALA